MLEADEDGIPKFESPEKYERYAINVEPRSSALAQKARGLAVRMRAVESAAEFGATSEAERECLDAMSAYEWVLFKKHGKRLKASYLRRAIMKVGIITAVNNAVSKDEETAGYHALVAEGMKDMLFEVVVVKHPEVFSPEAVEKSTQRLARWEAGTPPHPIDT